MSFVIRQKVVGSLVQTDPGVDRVALQTAFDAATPGTTIEVEGTFQLDGERILISTSDLTLAALVLDDDGDGRANEDGWDAAILGVADAGGGSDIDLPISTPRDTRIDLRCGLRFGLGLSDPFIKAEDNRPD